MKICTRVFTETGWERSISGRKVKIMDRKQRGKRGIIIRCPLWVDRIRRPPRKQAQKRCLNSCMELESDYQKGGAMKILQDIKEAVNYYQKLRARSWVEAFERKREKKAGRLERKRTRITWRV